MYDGQIALMDAGIGELMAGLKARGRYENALIVVTSDHGELLGEHDQLGHGGRMMYEGLLHIPMVVKLPGADRPRGDVVDPVQLVDILPTVAAVVGADLPSGVQGEALPHVRHEIVAEEHINPEFVAHYGAVYDRAIRVLYDPPYKLMATSKGERMLFDLARDPGEATNLVSRHPARAKELESRLEATMSIMLTDAGTPPG
jgi:arylsulfatase A-like enzyme